MNEQCKSRDEVSGVEGRRKRLGSIGGVLLVVGLPVKYRADAGLMSVSGPGPRKTTGGLSCILDTLGLKSGIPKALGSMTGSHINCRFQL